MKLKKYLICETDTNLNSEIIYAIDVDDAVVTWAELVTLDVIDRATVVDVMHMCNGRIVQRKVKAHTVYSVEEL